jgi:predicted RNase H-like nuclease
MTIHSEAWAHGIDLAWSPKNKTGVALARVTEQEVRVVESGRVETDTQIIAWAEKAGGKPLTIAIDVQTIVPNETGMRPCEKLLQGMFSKQHAGPYPSNRVLLGKQNGGVPRGEVISQRFQTELGALGTSNTPPPPRTHSALR